MPPPTTHPEPRTDAPATAAAPPAPRSRAPAGRPPPPITLPRRSPLALLFGPVFQKEVRVLGRHRATYFARFIYPLLLLGVLSFAFYGLTRSLANTSAAARIQGLQALAPVLAITIAWCQFAVLMFVAPISTAGAICDERTTRSLDTLMTTPMSAAEIILGKLTARLAQVVILILSSAPLLLAVRVFGGLDAEFIAASTAITLSASVLAASLGILFSVWHRRAASAAVFALLTMVLCSGPAITLLILDEINGSATPPDWHFAVGAPTALAGLSAEAAGAPIKLDSRMIWTTSTAINLALSALVLTAASLALRRVMLAQAGVGSAAERRSSRRPSPAALKARPAPGANLASTTPASATPADADAPTRDRARSREVSDRPVLWREVRGQTMGPRYLLVIACAVAGAGLIWLYWNVPFSDTGLHHAVVLVTTGVFLVQTALIAPSLIAGEREARSLDALLTTTLTPAEIVAGKCVGALRRSWLPASVLGLHLAIGLAVGWLHPALVLHLVIIIGGAATLLTGTGILLSVWFRRPGPAAVWNLAIALLLWLGLPIALSLTDEFYSLYNNPYFNAVLYAVELINPFGASIMATENSVLLRRFRYTPLAYQVNSSNYSGRGSFPGLLLFTGHLLLAYGSLAITGIAAAVAAAAALRRRAARVG